jgi:hypothetical protein
MVGYPICRNSTGCVDPISFLASLRDPRALGRGDCALSAMVSHSTTSVPGGGPTLYTCPSFVCASSPSVDDLSVAARNPLPELDTAATPGRPSLTPAQQNNLPWPQLTQDDISVMHALCAVSGKGSREQGDEKAGDCFFGNQAKNPFDNSLHCTSEGASGVKARAASGLR